MKNRYKQSFGDDLIFHECFDLLNCPINYLEDRNTKDIFQLKHNNKEYHVDKKKGVLIDAEIFSHHIN